MYLKELVMWLSTNIVIMVISVLGISTPSKVELGIYDYDNQYSDVSKIAIQHEYLGWNDYDSKYTISQLNKIIDNHRQLLVTLEPWPIYSDLSISSKLFEDIVSGRYDLKIKEVCTDLSRFGPLLLRWGHEMDLGAGRYTWSGGDPKKYIEAYKHFNILCRTVAPQIKYVWSPAGNKGLDVYYPGNDYVDYIGLSLYYYPQWQALQVNKNSSFRSLFSQKYDLVKRYQKPIIIAELGVAGTSEFQKKWLIDAFNQFTSFPLLRQVIYFNATDHPGVWGENLPIPDWRLSRSTLESFLGLF
jgi:cellulose synthase (UDP-forming)